MGERSVVVGDGPDAVRAASWLAASGAEVTLVAESEPTMEQGFPLGRGVARVPADAPAVVAAAFVPAGGLDAALLTGRRVHHLPLSVSALASALGAAQVADATTAWARTRASIELRRLIGGGQETRTYRDWVVGRFGEPVYERLHSAWCGKRFGDPTRVSASVARWAHVGDAGPASVPAAGFAGALDGVRVVRADVRAVRGGAVDTSDGRLEGRVWVAAPPQRACAWLDETFVREVASDVGGLVARDLVQYRFQGGVDLPFETFVIDASVPVYRLLRPGVLPGGPGEASLVGHVGLASDAPTPEPERIGAAVTAGGVSVSVSGPAVRLAGWLPVWEGPHLSRYRRYLLALAERGITPVGRTGLFAPVDVAQELTWLERVRLGEAPREVYRTLIEPGFTDRPEDAHLRRFAVR